MAAVSDPRPGNRVTVGQGSLYQTVQPGRRFNS